MTSSTTQSTLSKLARDYPSNDMKNLIQLNPYQDLGSYSMAFSLTADRVAESYKAKPEDDTILMPYLTLYRQAFELLLKDIALSFGAFHRRTGSDLTEFSMERMADRIGHKGFGHSLHKSFAYFEKHFEELGLATEPLPASLPRAIRLLHSTDPSGTNFRYPDDKLAEVLNIDFLKLHKELQEAIGWLWAVYSFVDDALESVPSPN